MISVWTHPSSMEDVTDEPAVLVTYWGDTHVTYDSIGLTDCERVLFLEGL